MKQYFIASFLGNDVFISSVQLLSSVWLFATLWTAESMEITYLQSYRDYGRAKKNLIGYDSEILYFLIFSLFINKP